MSRVYAIYCQIALTKDEMVHIMSERHIFREGTSDNYGREYRMVVC